MWNSICNKKHAERAIWKEKFKKSDFFLKIVDIDRGKIWIYDMKKCECGCGCDHQKLTCGAQVRAKQYLKCGCACAAQQTPSQPNVWIGIPAHRQHRLTTTSQDKGSLHYKRNFRILSKIMWGFFPSKSATIWST